MKEIIVDARKTINHPISPRGNGKTFMATAYMLAWSESYSTDKPVPLSRGYELLREFLNDDIGLEE